mmetsp:Transcript_32884/g.82967  ORF Transcript_32884/g.82967 Transcript_32884/m.82967 type:complete len:267 (+) Transcript_32884:377-1177(+)
MARRIPLLGEAELRLLIVLPGRTCRHRVTLGELEDDDTELCFAEILRLLELHEDALHLLQQLYRGVHLLVLEHEGEAATPRVRDEDVLVRPLVQLDGLDEELDGTVGVRVCGGLCGLDARLGGLLDVVALVVVLRCLLVQSPALVHASVVAQSVARVVVAYPRIVRRLVLQVRVCCLFEGIHGPWECLDGGGAEDLSSLLVTLGRQVPLRGCLDHERLVVLVLQGILHQLFSICDRHPRTRLYGTSCPILSSPIPSPPQALLIKTV